MTHEEWATKLRVWPNLVTINGHLIYCMYLLVWYVALTAD